TIRRAPRPAASRSLRRTASRLTAFSARRQSICAPAIFHAGMIRPPVSVILKGMKVWIGTSGYSYPDWVGSFYPEGTRPNRMLAHYAQHFPLVELNFTFYRPPTPDVLARLAEQTPAGFRFLVTVPRPISHEEPPR